LSYLIDTNVLSELRRKTPNVNVVKWVNSRPATSLYLSVLTLGELRKGIDNLADTKRRLKLVDWLETELPLFLQEEFLQLTKVLQIDGAGCWLQLGAPFPPLTVC